MTRYLNSHATGFPRLQPIQKAGANATANFRSKGGFKAAAYTCGKPSASLRQRGEHHLGEPSCPQEPPPPGASSTAEAAAEPCSSASPRDVGGSGDWSRADLHGTSDLFIQLQRDETLPRNCSRLSSSRADEGWMSLVLILVVFPAK